MLAKKLGVHLPCKRCSFPICLQYLHLCPARLCSLLWSVSQIRRSLLCFDSATSAKRSMRALRAHTARSALHLLCVWSLPLFAIAPAHLACARSAPSRFLERCTRARLTRVPLPPPPLLMCVPLCLPQPGVHFIYFDAAAWERRGYSGALPLNMSGAGLASGLMSEEEVRVKLPLQQA